MLGIHDLSLFIFSGILLNIMPGPDSLLIMTKSSSQGWRAGSAAALGIGCGTLVHVLAAALGLSAILATSATAFTVLKVLGAVYLVYIGIQALRYQSASRAAAVGSDDQPVSRPVLSMWKIYWQGFLTNVLNPKVALFFLAFVPQFIDPQAPQKALAFIMLGLMFNASAMLWYHFLAVSTAMASSKLKASKAVRFCLNKTIGVLFISMGVKLAMTASN
ncbi:LysE family translocator [Dickeya sp. CFBP 2040]|uniref:LysE family translocator n=1 Tax=Dickeya poaceiphila TaxID=568768 RepID=A0A5B8HQH9_9GAMM|nr:MULTISPECIES: LysE family translocator [Dickeya]NKI72908.1 LysE family translocator [Dickeya sp. CFBP 2040]QDX31315.1 LysE family translocator [Dickeya poaceiphila]